MLDGIARPQVGVMDAGAAREGGRGHIRFDGIATGARGPVAAQARDLPPEMFTVVPWM